MLDAVVIGAGFGGLAAALTLAEGGAQVAICESLNYPGGCASTFHRSGYTFESGATLFAGFEPGQLFAKLIERHALAVRTVALDPVIELRAPGLVLPVPPARERLVEQLSLLPSAPVDRLRAFFKEQRRVADALWALLDDPALLPPFGAAELARHAARAPRYLPLLPLLGRPLFAVLARHGLLDFAPLRLLCDALCQITVQAPAAEAEAPFALATLDYPFRGARHIHGGVGQLANGLLEAARAQGAEVRLSDRVKSVRREGAGFVVQTRRGELRAREVVLNVLPAAARELLGLREGERESKKLDALDHRVQGGWGAAMLYLALPRDAPLREGPHHLELVADPALPLRDGNHLFCSVSGGDEEGRGPRNERTVTVSTHIALADLLGLPKAAQAARVSSVQAQMEATLQKLAPELCQSRALTLTASPRTFERFLGRPGGFVGGVPRRAGLQNYRNLAPGVAAPGVHLVGDSVFPGQSTLAVAISGIKAAEQVLAKRRP